MTNFLATDLDHLTGMIKHRLKVIQCHPDVIDGCLTTTGLTITHTRHHPLTLVSVAGRTFGRARDGFAVFPQGRGGEGSDAGGVGGPNGRLRRCG
ncbi:hypothetical protein [Actinomadura rudentiformis]|uniref:hypothetical protein n=1 Tax=Actinomadura rudentiformis TaxID=359158 RepID=UPI001CEFA66B|nr:hypothetical protein [Actinomadura rudentiformis]